MGYEFDANGIFIGWSPFFNYSSIQSLKKSEELPTPNGNEYTYSDKGLDFAGKILDTIQHNINIFTEDKDYAINIENVPGESANVKLCKKDHDLFETDLYLKIFEDNKFLNNL